MTAACAASTVWGNLSPAHAPAHERLLVRLVRGDELLRRAGAWARQGGLGLCCSRATARGGGATHDEVLLEHLALLCRALAEEAELLGLAQLGLRERARVLELE